MNPEHHTLTERNESDITKLQKYLYSLPQFGLGLIGLWWCWMILTRLPPSAIANAGGQNVYAPLLIGAVWSSFWLAAFLLSSWRQALWVSMVVGSWFWLRLHQQSLFPSLFLFAAVLIGVEVYLTHRRSQR